MATAWRDLLLGGAATPGALRQAPGVQLYEFAQIGTQMLLI